MWRVQASTSLPLGTHDQAAPSPHDQNPILNKVYSNITRYRPKKKIIHNINTFDNNNTSEHYYYQQQQTKEAAQYGFTSLPGLRQGVVSLGLGYGCS